MNNIFDFGGKTVVVMGGTSGINLGVAECFARQGAHVAVASRKPEKVASAVERLKNHGGEARGFAADVRDQGAVQAGLASIHTDWGDFDVLISGAAGNFLATAMGMSANGFKAVVEIDLLGTFHVMQAAYPFLKKPGASVVNISAPQAFIPMQAQAHVCAAKAGVDMITRCLALEWGGDGIRCNSVCPGPIDKTEGMARLAPTEEMRAATIQSVPLQRLGEPQDIGYACLFLASDAASYISGVVLPVDGGWAQAGASSMANGLEMMVEMQKQQA